MTFSLGWVEVGSSVYAYLQPDGSWGYSNAGLVVGSGSSLLVDTLFDLRLTRAMLDTAPLGGTSIATVVNTHANGDHCYGNQLVTGASFVSSSATATEMEEVPASMLASLQGADLGDDANLFISEAFGAFRFDDIAPVSIDQPFAGSLALDAGGRPVSLEEVGPAHTAGDVIAQVGDVVFSGDILFIGGTPIVWAGPVSNWVAALDRIVALAPRVIVPGHGPLTDLAGVASVSDYFRRLEEGVRVRHASGMGVIDTAWDIGPHQDWTDSERTVVNVDAVFASLDPAHKRMDAVTSFTEMGRWRREHRRR